MSRLGSYVAAIASQRASFDTGGNPVRGPQNMDAPVMSNVPRGGEEFWG